VGRPRERVCQSYLRGLNLINYGRMSLADPPSKIHEAPNLLARRFHRIDLRNESSSWYFLKHFKALGSGLVIWTIWTICD
ncbi:MAG: hypothetical protein ACREIC_04505, partial [Limisphaerales bacterium]